MLTELRHCPVALRFVLPTGCRQVRLQPRIPADDDDATFMMKGDDENEPGLLCKTRRVCIPHCGTGGSQLHPVFLLGTGSEFIFRCPVLKQLPPTGARTMIIKGDTAPEDDG